MGLNGERRNDVQSSGAIGRNKFRDERFCCRKKATLRDALTLQSWARRMERKLVLSLLDLEKFVAPCLRLQFSGVQSFCDHFFVNIISKNQHGV
jgi:hypothetical protein